MARTLGSNLSGIAYYSTESPFLNRLKQADIWIVTGGSASMSDMAVDANGYPTTMTLTGGAGTATAFEAHAFFSQPGFVGNIVLLYDGGSGNTVSLTNLGAAIFSSTGRIIYNNTVSGNSTRLRITAIDGASPITNIRVVYSPDSTSSVIGTNEALLNAGEFFNPDFVARLRQIISRNGTGCLRFMDWQKTNQSVTQNWADRTGVNWWTWGHEPTDGYANADKNVGVPVEAMCALCNQLNADAWFCMPIQATNSYITQFATAALPLLNRKAYCEYGNEYWSGVLTSANASYQQTQGNAIFPSASGTFLAVIDFANKRMVDTADLWAAVWPSSRLVRVGAGQMGSPSRSNTQLAMTTPVDGSAALWTGTAASHWDAFAVAPYWGPEAMPVAWTADSDGGLDKFWQQINAGLLLPDGASSHTTSGTSTAYTVTSGQSLPSTPANGTIVCIKFHTGTGLSPTLAADGGTAFTLYYLNEVVGSGTNAFSFATNEVLNATLTSSLKVPIRTDVPPYPAASLSIASPAVISLQQHGFAVNTSFTFTTTGALPTGTSVGVTYFVISAGYTDHQFEFSTSLGGAAVNTSGGQSGTHTITVTLANPIWALTPVGIGSPGQIDFWSTTSAATNYSMIHGTYGLRMVCYEGGQQLLSLGYGPMQALYTSVNLFDYNRMYSAYLRFVRQLWANSNNDLFLHFNDFDEPSNFGFWGAAPSLADIPTLGVHTGWAKYDALMDLTVEDAGPGGNLIATFGGFGAVVTSSRMMGGRR